MARFDDLYERFRKKRKEKGTGYSGAEPFSSARNAVTVTPETSEYTGTGRFAGILEKARKNGVSFSGVDENYIQSFMQDAQSFVKKSQQERQSLTWAGATSQEQYDNRVKAMQDLGSRADAVRVYLNANKGKINPEWYDYLSGFLRDFDSDTQSIFETFHGAKGYYSQWDSQEAYDFYDAHSTPEKRQEWYAGLETQREKLEAEKEKETAAWQKIGEEIENPYEYWEKEEVYNSKIESIQEQIDKIDTEMRQYERSGYNERGQHYGSKVADDALALSKEKDFATLSQKRDHKNPTREELDLLDSMNNSANWDYDETGTYWDAYGNKIVTGEDGKMVSSKAKDYAIQDRLGLFLSATETDMEEYMGTIVNGTWGALLGEGIEGSWDQLNENEIGVYYYLLNKDGQAAAEKYLAEMKPELNRRTVEAKAQSNAQRYNEAGFVGKLLLNTATVPANLLGGIAGLAENTAHLIRGEEVNPYSSAHSMTRFSNTIREETAKELDELMPGVKIPGIDFTVGDLYQTVMSRADSLAAMGIGGKLGGVLLATGAAENEMTRLYEQGASVKQMIWGAATAGAAELVFESIGIDKLLSIKDGKHAHSLVMNILSQGGAEALEEGATEIANIISNAIVMGNQSDWNKLVKEKNGDKKAAFLEKVRDVAKAGFGGVLSGAMGGAAMTKDGKTQEDIKADIDRMTPMDAEWTLETQPETRVEEVGLPLQDPKQAEAELKKQRFAVDLTRYSEKQRATVQAAMDSGVLNNTKKTHDFVDMVAKIAGEKGVAFQFADNKRLQELGYYLPDVTVNGVTTEKGIVLNMNSGKLLNRVVGHEITHVLEGSPELYNAMADSILELARTKGEYDSRMAQLTKLYEGREGYTGEDANAKIQKELVADLVGDYLFSDESFVKKLSTENRNLFQKIWDEVKYLCKVVTAGSKEARQLATLEKRFAELYRAETENPTGDGGVKYDLSKDINGDVFVDVKDDIFDANNGESIARTIQKVIAERFNNLIDVHGQKIQINKTTNDEFRRSNSANELLEKAPQAYKDKLRTIANADEILSAAKHWIGEEAKHQRKDDIVEFARADVKYRVGENGYVADVIVGTRKNGAAVLYDLVNIYETKITEAPVTMASEGHSQRRQDASAEEIVPYQEPGVNRKNSLSEKVAEDIAPMPWEVRGQDVSLEGVVLPTPEDIARMEAGERAQGAQEPGQEAQAPEEIGFPTREDVAQMEAQEQPGEEIGTEDYEGEEDYEETVEDRLEIRKRRLQYEARQNQAHREEVTQRLEAEIAALREEYDGLQNKNTKKANQLLRRIDNKTGQLTQRQAEYDKTIRGLQERIAKVEEKLQQDHTKENRMEKAYRRMVNHGTEEDPQWEEILSPVEMGWNEANEEIAKKEAHNGEYTRF